MPTASVVDYPDVVVVQYCLRHLVVVVEAALLVCLLGLAVVVEAAAAVLGEAWLAASAPRRLIL
jgi:hypothetical protein